MRQPTQVSIFRYALFVLAALLLPVHSAFATHSPAFDQPVTQSTTTYTYNDANNRVTKTVTRHAASSTDAGENDVGHWIFGYNEANQLTSWEKWDEPSGTLLRTATLTYDDNGNRETQTISQVSGQNGSGTHPPAAATGQMLHTWDALDRLTAVEMPDGTTHTYAYDHRTRRHGITRSGGSLPPHQTLLTFTGGLSAAEWEAEDATPDIINDPPTVEYQRGPDMGGGVGGMLYSKRGSTLKYSLSNGRGDIIAQSDAAATITWTASYEAGGKRPVETGTNPDKQRGNSKDEDPTGLLNENLRYRELEHMVWLSRDPAGFVDGLNLYAYVRQNPWTGFDPLGLKTKADYERQHDQAEQSYEAIKNKMVDGEGTFGDLVKAGIYQASMKQNKEAISRIESTAKHLNELWGNDEFHFDSNRLDDEKHSALFQVSDQIKNARNQAVFEGLTLGVSVFYQGVKSLRAGTGLAALRSAGFSDDAARAMQDVVVSNNVAVRQHYLKILDGIPRKIDSSLPIREQALQAFQLRNAAKVEARAMMTDRQAAALLDKTDPIPTIQDVVRKVYDGGRGPVGDDMWRAILESSTRSRSSVNQSLGIGN